MSAMTVLAGMPVPVTVTPRRLAVLGTLRPVTLAMAVEPLVVLPVKPPT